MATARDRSRSPHGAATEEILKLVLSREQARNAKDWPMADGLRDQLQALGVQLMDKQNIWRHQDGRTGRIPTWVELEGGQGQLTETMLQQSNVGIAAAADSSEQGQIKFLVMQREQARAAKDFTRSDQLREELKAMGVELFDKEKLWKTQTGLQGIIVGYKGQNPTDNEVTTLVLQREKARSDKDFDKADMIRDELKQFGVEIHDKDKIWRTADGHSGPIPAWSQINITSQIAVMPLQQGIYGGVGQVARQTMMAPPAAALATRPLMSGGRGGQPLFARPAPAAARPARAAPFAMPARQSPEVQQAMTFIRQAANRAVSESEIMWLVETREKLRQNKDFASSDELRDAMRNQLGVEFYEKEKRWASKNGLQGAIPMWA